MTLLLLLSPSRFGEGAEPAVVIPSVPVGTTITCLIANPQRRILTQVHPDVGAISWRISDFGVVKITMARKDTNLTEDNFKVGNWLYLTFGNGLPDWAGFIVQSPKPVWTYHDVTFTVHSAEAYLKRFQTDKGRYFSKATAGYIFRSVIGDANSAHGMGINIGDVFDGGVPHSPSYHLKDLFWIVQNSVCQRLEDLEFDVKPSLQNGRIELVANLYKRKGIPKPNLSLIQGVNMFDETFVEAGSMVNHWQTAGADISGDNASGWGNGRLISSASDVASIAKHGLWMDSEVLNGIESQGELDNLTSWLLKRSRVPRFMICCNGVDKKPARFGEYVLGDSLRAIAPVATFRPYDGMVRVLGREFNHKNGGCSLALEAESELQ